VSALADGVHDTAHSRLGCRKGCDGRLSNTNDPFNALDDGLEPFHHGRETWREGIDVSDGAVESIKGCQLAAGK
jgi:hypothetical protein